MILNKYFVKNEIQQQSIVDIQLIPSKFEK